MKWLLGCLTIAGIVTLLLASLVLWDCHWAAIETKAAIIETRATIGETAAAIGEVRTYAHNSSQNLNAVLLQWGLASDELRRTAMEQRASLKKSDAEMHELMASANRAVGDLDGTIKDLDRSQLAVAENANTALGELRTSLESSEKLMETSTATMASAGDRLKDPHLVEAIAHLDGAVGHVDASTAMLEGELRKWTAPVSKVKSFFARSGEWVLQKLVFDLIP